MFIFYSTYVMPECKIYSQVSGYLLQTAQSWANAGVTEDGHCQGACRPQWFFYVPNLDGTDINVILRFTRDTQSPMLTAIFLFHNCRYRGSNPCRRRGRRMW